MLSISQFINLPSGSDLAVGNGVQSCTSKIEHSKTFPLFGKSITLVDIPAFDNGIISDEEVLSLLAVHLSAMSVFRASHSFQWH